MAKITQDIQATGDPDYLRNSRGADPKRANGAWGDLFAGIGEVGGMAVNVADQAVQNRIKTDVQAGYNDALDKQGVNVATSAIPNDVVTFPGQDGFQEKASRLQAARDAGKISDTMYYAQLNSMVKGLKSKYPGYGDQVDQIVQNTTGIVPANSLRSSMLRDMEAVSGKKGEEEKWLWEQVKSLGEFLHPDETKAMIDGTGNKWEILHKAQARRNESWQVGQERAGLALAADKNVVVKGEATNLLQRDIGTAWNKTLTTAMSGMAQELQAIAGTSSGPLNADQQAQVARKFAEFRTNTITQLNALTRQPLDSNNPNSRSYRSLIGESEVQTIVDNYIKNNVDPIQDMLFNKDYGKIDEIARGIKAAEDDTTGQLMKDDVVRLAAATRKLFGDPNLNSILLGVKGPDGNTMQGELWRRLGDQMATKIASGQATPSDAFKSLGEAAKKTSVPGSAYKSVVQQWSNIISNPSVPATTKVTTAKQIFGDQEFFSKLNPTAARQTYGLMTGPNVQAEMLKVKEQDPAAWEAYKNWTAKGFVTLFNQDIQSLQSQNSEYVNYYKINYDAKTSQFRVDLTKAGEASPDIAAYTSGIQKTINGINESMRNVSGVLKADGMDAGQELSSMLKGRGWTGGQTKPSGFIQQLRDALTQGTGEGTTGKGALPSEAPKKPEKQSSLIDFEALPQIQTALERGTETGSDPIKVALGYLGMDENNPDQNDTLHAFFKNSMGRSIDPQSTAWCAAFVNSVLGSTGIKGNGSLGARSFLDFGTSTDKPMKGDIVVLSRGGDPSKGHVGFFVGWDNGNPVILGGNQDGGKKVSMSTFPVDQVLGFRRPPKPNEIAQM